MPNKGQIISFFVIFTVIVFAGELAISNGDNLKQDKDILQPAFVASDFQEPQQSKPEPESEPEPEPEPESGTLLEPESRTLKSEPEPDATVNPISRISESEIETAFIAIDDGSEPKKEFVLELTATTTVLDLLQEACETLDFVIESQEYEFGVIIEAINNKKNSQNDKYWLYYINDVMPQLTVDKIIANPDDKIEFKFTSR